VDTPVDLSQFQYAICSKCEAVMLIPEGTQFSCTLDHDPTPMVTIKELFLLLHKRKDYSPEATLTLSTLLQKVQGAVAQTLEDALKEIGG